MNTSSAAASGAIPPELSALAGPRPGDADLARLLTLVERTITTRLGDVLKAHGATIDEWRVLSMLSDHSGHTMSEIAEFTMLNPPTLTKLVDRMVSANLVLRRTDEADRRRVLVFASATGHRVLARWSNLVHNEQQTLVAALGPEDRAAQNPAETCV